MKVSLVALAVTIALAVAGCGGADVTIKRGGGDVPKPLVKWGKPSGQPQGLVVLLHGGGWQPNHFAYEDEMPLARSLQRRGFATVVIGYDTGATGFRQIQQVYLQARKRYPDLPVCVHGISAGGNLGLMLAARESGIDCVVSLLGPTDLTTLGEQGGKEAYDLAVNAFGQDHLANFSPVNFAGRIKAKVMMIMAQTDPVVPVEQGREFARARPQSRLVVLPAGPTPVDWLHGARVQADGPTEAVNKGFDFIEQSTGGG